MDDLKVEWEQQAARTAEKMVGIGTKRGLGSSKSEDFEKLLYCS